MVLRMLKPRFNVLGNLIYRFIMCGAVNRSEVPKYLVKKPHMPGSAEPKASVDCNIKEIK